MDFDRKWLHNRHSCEGTFGVGYNGEFCFCLQDLGPLQQRDALIADLAPPLDMKGACFGLRQTLAVTGSLLGAILGIFLMWLTSQNYRIVFILSILPALCGITLLIFGVREPPVPDPPVQGLKNLFQFSHIFDLPTDYWSVVILSFLFMLGNLSGSFLLLSAKQQGILDNFLPLAMVVQNFITSVTAFPFGKVADSVDRRIILRFDFLTDDSVDRRIILRFGFLTDPRL